jgi:hypothetical protein
LDSDEEDGQTLDEICKSVAQGEIDLDKTMVSTAHAGKSKGVDPDHLLSNPRHGRSIHRRRNGHSKLHHRTTSGLMTQHHPGTTEQTTACFGASGLESAFSWTHSLLPRRLANCLVVIVAASHS